MLVERIAYDRRWGVTFDGAGEMTSSSEFLDISLNVASILANGIAIKSSIADLDSRHKVGFRISGSRVGMSYVYLLGDRSNTFSGNVYVSGRGNALVLQKDKNAIAVQGDIHVSDGAFLILKGSSQTLPSSSLKIKEATLQFGNIEMNLLNKFSKLTVEGDSILDFMHSDSRGGFTSNRMLYLDDIEILKDGKLLLREWQSGRDFLLVRKDSKNLAGALKKLEFQGYDRNNIHLVDYNKDYWEISAAPEPATYGAIFGVLGLVVFARHKQRRRYSDTALTGPHR